MNHGGLNIADWLEGLGMAGYAGRFAENRIDISVLPELSDQDLKELGVVLGDRRKMLRAIRKLVAVEPVEDRPAPRARAEARRRRAPAADCDVLRSRRLDRDVGTT